MHEIFADLPEALASASEIAQQCHFDFPLGRRRAPSLEAGGRKLQEAALRDLLAQRLPVKYGGSPEMPEAEALRELAEQRIEQELAMVEREGLAEVFLVARRVAAYAACGYARYDAGGSIINYLLGVTDTDPIGCGLMSESFFEVPKGKWPSLTFEFPGGLLGGLLAELRKNYGDRSLARIATFFHFSARSLMQLLAPDYGIDKTRALTLMPEPCAESSALGTASPSGSAGANADSRAADLLATVACLQDLPREPSRLEVTFLLSRNEIGQRVPVFCSDDGEMVSQYACDDLDELGYLKFSVLSMRALSVVAGVIHGVLESKGRRIDPSSISIEDSRAYRTLSKGDLAGFQEFDSRRLSRILSQLEPEDFEELMAAVAAWRMPTQREANVFIRLVRGMTQPRSPYPLLSDLTASTYGTFIYQEQLLDAIMVLTGCKLHEAIRWSQALCRRRPGESLGQRKDFVQLVCASHEMGSSEAGQLFAEIRRAAITTSWKVHIAAQARTLLKLAFLKAHYPQEFTLIARKVSQAAVVYVP